MQNHIMKKILNVLLMPCLLAFLSYAGAGCRKENTTLKEITKYKTSIERQRYWFYYGQYAAFGGYYSGTDSFVSVSVSGTSVNVATSEHHGVIPFQSNTDEVITFRSNTADTAQSGVYRLTFYKANDSMVLTYIKSYSGVNADWMNYNTK